MKYLYGAAVQGIQPFVFQTNKLREIAGASELVEQICTERFAGVLEKPLSDLVHDAAVIQMAAGNIKYLFDSKEECEKVVLKFPMQVMQFAPGITISQAVVKIGGNTTMQKAVNQLEKRLRTQRNKPFRPYDLGLMVMNRARNTGLPSVDKIPTPEGSIEADAGTVAKDNARNSRRLFDSLIGESNYRPSDIPWEMEEITQSNSKSYSWLAVVHADGNNMGLMVQKLAETYANIAPELYAEKFRAFSVAIDAATKAAAQTAYKTVYPAHEKRHKTPFRPIVVGGDDLTVICRGDLAIDFTKAYLDAFEKETQKKFGALGIDFLKQGITACAGIAYIKESYPFHYGYTLSEALCGYAKKISKKISKELNHDRTPSSLMFHKVRDSFVEDYEIIKQRELTAGETGDISLCYGPYFIEKQNGTFSTIDQLLESVQEMRGKEGNAVKSDLRQWLTDLHESKEMADQKWDRLRSISEKYLQNVCNDNNLVEMKGVIAGKTPVYDWLTIHSINQKGEEK